MSLNEARKILEQNVFVELSPKMQENLDKTAQLAKDLTPVNNNHEPSPEEQEINPEKHINNRKNIEPKCDDEILPFTDPTDEPEDPDL